MHLLGQLKVQNNIQSFELPTILNKTGLLKIQGEKTVPQIYFRYISCVLHYINAFKLS